MAHHTLRIKWFGNAWLTKHYKYNCLNVRGLPNVTYTMDSGQWFEGPRLTKRDVYNGLETHGSPTLTNKWVLWPMAHQALHIQWCGDALLTKPYKYISLNIHGSPNVTYTKVCGHMAHQTLQICPPINARARHTPVYAPLCA